MCPLSAARFAMTVHPPFFAVEGRCVRCCRCAVRVATQQAAMPDSPPSKSSDGDAPPFHPLPPLPPGFPYQRVRNQLNESSPPPGLEPAMARGTGGVAPPAVRAALRLLSATAGADTAAATTRTGGTTTAAGGCASLPASAATTCVDAVAPAKSGAALGCSDVIGVDEAAPTPSKKARTDRLLCVCFLAVCAISCDALLFIMAGRVPHVSQARVKSVLATPYEMESASVAHCRCKTPCLSYAMRGRRPPAFA